MVTAVLDALALSARARESVPPKRLTNVGPLPRRESDEGRPNRCSNDAVFGILSLREMFEESEFRVASCHSHVDGVA
eukprot:scaffold9441_cov49-Attheya_sp.AAC.5